MRYFFSALPRLDLKTCKNCGKHASEVGVMSHTRLCAICGPLLQAEHNSQLHEHRGPAFQEWRRNIAASVGAVVLDDLPRQT